MEPERENSTMKNHLYDVRTFGLAAVVAVVVTMTLPWFTVSAPLLGTVSVSGFKVGGDGYVYLGFAVLVAVAAFFRRRILTGVGLGLLALGLVWEYVYALISLAGTSGDDDFKVTVSVSPGIGLILGLIIAGVSAAWLLVGLRPCKASVWSDEHDDLLVCDLPGKGHVGHRDVLGRAEF